MRHSILIPVLATCLLLGGFSGNVLSQDADSRIETASVPVILENLDSIDTAMSADDQRLAALSEKDKLDLAAEQANVRKLLSGKEALSELSSSDRHSAFNSLEMIHGIVTGNRDERIICRSEHTVGTHRRKTNCMTASQRRQARELALKTMAVRGYIMPPSE